MQKYEKYFNMQVKNQFYFVLLRPNYEYCQIYQELDTAFGNGNRCCGVPCLCLCAGTR